MTVAVLMAGGGSERMRATAGPTHKTLVPVVGVPILERNLHYIISHGFRKIIVAINHAEHDLEEFILSRGHSIAEATGSKIEIKTEYQRLGTIGAAREAGGADSLSLIVNADNLASIHLGDLVDHHRQTGADLTISVHNEQLKNPFGELVCEDGFVLEYLEKSTRSIPVSSGVYVLGPRARKKLMPGQRIDVPDLFRSIRAAGDQVAAYEHDSPWIDINDAAALRRAEHLVVSNPEVFERMREVPDRSMAALIWRSSLGVFVTPVDASVEGRAELWTVPCAKIDPSSGSATERVAEAFGKAFRQVSPGLQVVTVFDELDLDNGEVTRYEVFLVEGPADLATQLPHGEAGKWMALDLIQAETGFGAASLRAAASLRVFDESRVGSA